MAVNKYKANSVTYIPQVNYNDRAIAVADEFLVATFDDREVSRIQRNGSPRTLISAF
jgi:hypothetical protein